ncbi:MAG: cadherin [Planctomycetes bacterium]|nr:cadherin [Planctomycetota bacterium]
MKLIAVILLTLLSLPLSAQSFGTQLFVSGLIRPVYVCSPPGDTTRVFIIEQLNQRIRLVKNGVLLATAYLTIPTASISGNERGVLGMAFHPNYASNGYLYVNFTDTAGNTQIMRYQRSAANPDLAAPTGTLLFAVTQPYSNHNGGMLAFGPDGYLWIGMGDGGSAGDPSGNAQNLTAQLGKLLRIDVNTPTGALSWSNPPSNPYYGAVVGHDSIMHYGMRNPWRFSFDRWNGDLWIGDVGQNAAEEIDYLAAGTAGGKNFGWRCYEGNMAYNTAGCAALATMTAPVYAYAQGPNGYCVIGGYVYRGNAIPGLNGTYFFSDNSSNKIWSMRKSATPPGYTAFTDRTGQLDPPGAATITTVSSFGEDADGELYICDLNGGEVFKIVPVAPTYAATLTRTTPPTIGTAINFTLSSASNPFKAYAFAWSMDSIPGISLPDGRIIPLNMDSVFDLSLQTPNVLFPNNYGSLNNFGVANASVLLPAYPPLIGLNLNGAFVVLDTTAFLNIGQISNLHTMTLQ